MGAFAFASAGGSGGTIGGIVASGTVGSILFVGAGGVLTQDNAQLFWNDTNNRLGIGTSSPTAKFEVKGSGVGTVLIGEWGGGANYGALSLNGSLTAGNSNFYSSPSDTNLYINVPTSRGVFFLINNATNTLAINSSGFLGVATTAPTHSITLASIATGIAHYNTVDQVTNYERLEVSWATNIINIGTRFAGTGGLRALRIGCAQAAGSAIGTYLEIDPSASAPFFNFARSTSSTAFPFFSMRGLLPVASSGSQTIVAIDPGINQSGTAAYIALDVNPTEAFTGSGTKLLQRWAVGGTVKGSMDNTGLLTTGSATLHATNVALTNGAAASAGTLTNAPAAGNPTKWIPINDNGTTRYIPAW